MADKRGVRTMDTRETSNKSRRLGGERSPSASQEGNATTTTRNVAMSSPEFAMDALAKLKERGGAATSSGDASTIEEVIPANYLELSDKIKNIDEEIFRDLSYKNGENIISRAANNYARNQQSYDPRRHKKILELKEKEKALESYKATPQQYITEHKKQKAAQTCRKVHDLLTELKLQSPAIIALQEHIATFFEE